MNEADECLYSVIVESSISLKFYAGPFFFIFELRIIDLGLIQSDDDNTTPLDYIRLKIYARGT
jgi:hypothetical protein